jgi:hypothetical protein
VVWEPPGFQRAKRLQLKGGLVLVARAGGFIPNGNDDRSHRGTTLLALPEAGRGGVSAMMEGSGHECCEAVSTLPIAAGMPSGNFFVTVKIA